MHVSCEPHACTCAIAGLVNTWHCYDTEDDEEEEEDGGGDGDDKSDEEDEEDEADGEDDAVGGGGNGHSTSVRTLVMDSQSLRDALALNVVTNTSLWSQRPSSMMSVSSVFDGCVG